MLFHCAHYTMIVTSSCGVRDPAKSSTCLIIIPYLFPLLQPLSAQILFNSGIASAPGSGYNESDTINFERMKTMDIQKIISEVLEKLSENKDLRKSFNIDPVKVLEKTFNIDLPDDQINAVIAAIKAKLNIDDVADIAGKVLGGLGGLFGKK